MWETRVRTNQRRAKQLYILHFYLPSRFRAARHPLTCRPRHIWTAAGATARESFRQVRLVAHPTRPGGFLQLLGSAAIEPLCWSHGRAGEQIRPWKEGRANVATRAQVLRRTRWTESRVAGEEGRKRLSLLTLPDCKATPCSVQTTEEEALMLLR